MSSAVSSLDRIVRAVDSPRFCHPWVSDRGDGTFVNPVLYADYSDPDGVRVGDDFYLVASSFTCTPGLPILHSRDLVNWTLINHAVKNVPDVRYEQFQAGCGVWAPAIRFHAGKYWIFFPTPDEGIYVVTADHPAEKWSEPHLVQAGKGLIDPCPFWDDDGQAYLVHAYAGSRAGIKHRLRVCPMATDAGKLLGEGQIVFHQPEKHPTLEGPKFYKHNGWYYIFSPAGGVETGWQVVLRSKNVYGPYEDRIVLAQGKTPINGPHQGALLDTADDGWWFLHFQDAGVYGRIVHLQPVHWQDGWPVMGNKGEPVLRHAKPRTGKAQPIATPVTSDEFDSPKLGLQWQWNANHQENWYSLSARPGWLRLFAQPETAEFWQLPSQLLQKFPARTFQAEALLDFSALPDGGEVGLVVAGKSAASFMVRRDGTQHEIWLRRDRSEIFIAAPGSESIRLRVMVHDGGQCEFAYALKDEFITLNETFAATKGVWVGARIGLFATHPAAGGSGGHADVDYFRLAPVTSPS